MATRILVAEDEPALLEMYAELVTALGYECLCASDGDEAVAIARRERPAVVVTDYMMPGRTGVEVIRSLREAGLGDVPVVLVSAARPAKSELAEAWRFVPKPIDATKLERTLAEAVSFAAERRGDATPERGVSSPSPSPPPLTQDDILSWVAHELKTPLSTALAGTELAMRAARSGAPAEAIESFLQRVVRQISRMNELVNGLLDAAQLQGGRLELDIERIDLRSVVARALAEHRDAHPEIAFELSDGAPIVVDIDPARVRQIIDNLLSNAVKYGGPANRVVVSVDDGDRSAVVSVRDHGRGIAPDQLEHVFERFHRVPGSGARGHGLGLYIAAALASILGGELGVSSSPGEGSTFTLTLGRERT